VVKAGSAVRTEDAAAFPRKFSWAKLRQIWAKMIKILVNLIRFWHYQKSCIHKIIRSSTVAKKGAESLTRELQKVTSLSLGRGNLTNEQATKPITKIMQYLLSKFTVFVKVL